MIEIKRLYTYIFTPTCTLNDSIIDKLYNKIGFINVNLFCYGLIYIN